MTTVLITGARGLVGNAFRDIITDYPEYDFLFTEKGKTDLTKEEEVKALFEKTCPECVIHCAGQVGGIGRNLEQASEQFRDNIMINTNVVHVANNFKVKKFIGFGSVCAFPQDTGILREHEYLNGAPYYAHESYAWAKRMLTLQMEIYQKQFGIECCTVLPTNIYGKNDFYNLDYGHVVPVMIHKFHNAWKQNSEVEVWGHGTATREFLYSEDVARACLGLLKLEKMPQRLIFPGTYLSIDQLVRKIKESYSKNYGVAIEYSYNTDKPNGQMKRDIDHSLFNSLLPNANKTDIDDGIDISVRWLTENYDSARK